MSCWDILGIEPTDDRNRIRQAYEQQLKFATGADRERLEQAYREAAGEPGQPDGEVAATRTEVDRDATQAASADAGEGVTLDAQGSQVVREVVIQVQALLNDSHRSQQLDIWKAILCEPPADRQALRDEIADRLESQVRPMAENGSFPAPVCRFLGDWFGWYSLKEVADTTDERTYPEPDMAVAEDAQPPQMINFWPAVIGWIVGLAILASLFGGMGGG